MIKIGSTSIDTKIILAPLSGCSDFPFRLICREHGAKFCFYEMVDANSLTRKNPGSSRLLETHKDDEPIAAQLLGQDPIVMLDAAQRLLEIVKTPFLDINCACPVKKVIKKKAGAYLLRDKDMLCRIVKKLASRLPVPVTIKLRIGFDSVDVPHMTNLAVRCEASGAKALFVHGRTKAQGYAGDIDYAAIRAIKESVTIPVFGSGNIFGPELAKKMLTVTGCDGVLVGRGAFGNPWIFRDIEDYLKDGTLRRRMTTRSRKDVLKRHLAYVKIHKDLPPKVQMGIMRKVAMWYLSGFPSAKRLRGEISKARDYAGLLKVIDETAA